jgi:hypothetical protein
MTEEEKQTQPGIGKTVLLPGCSGCGLGCLGTLLLCLAAMALGLAIVPVNTAFLGGVAGFVVVFATAIAARIKGKAPPWHVFFSEIAIIAALLFGFFLWDTPRYVYSCVLGDPIPSSVKIIRAEYEEHPMDPSAWIHFSATPRDMAMLIATNQLTPVYPGRTTVGSYPDWFKHKELPGARNFQKEVPHSEHTNHTAYVIGLWINDKTNEAYGYYISL